VSARRFRDDEGYAAELAVGAPPEGILEALTTLDGLAGWWTPTVSGSPTAGGEITFGFADQKVARRVDRADLTSVAWTCLGQSWRPAAR